MDTAERMKRWRLILGAESEGQFQTMEGYGGARLSEEQLMMDQALAAIYNSAAYGGFQAQGGAGAPATSPGRKRPSFQGGLCLPRGT